MGEYKVIQDIEAEDKLVGPFGLRQFIYLLIVAASLFLMYTIGSQLWFLALPLVPHTLFFLLLALPFGGDQPTETWLLAKIRFAVKPRLRIWNQSGIQELVTITAPKKIERHLTKDLSQTEVKSRLEALAHTIDTRGWAVKNIDVNVFTQPALAPAASGSDRLVSAGVAAPAGGTLAASDDMLDAQNNPTAKNLDRMITESSKTRREQIVAQVKQQAAQSAAPDTLPPVQGTDQAQSNYWFLDKNAGATPPGQAIFPTQVVPPGTMPGINPATGKPTTPEEQALLDQIHAGKERQPKINYGHMRVVKPIGEQQAEQAATARKAVEAATKAPPKQAQPSLTPKPNPDILELATNDDLNVATIARQANKRRGKKRSPDGEVIIKLH